MVMATDEHFASSVNGSLHEYAYNTPLSERAIYFSQPFRCLPSILPILLILKRPTSTKNRIYRTSRITYPLECRNLSTKWLSPFYSLIRDEKPFCPVQLKKGYSHSLFLVQSNSVSLKQEKSK